MNRPYSKINDDSRMIYLASQSPRRAELLQQIGLEFRVLNAPVDESVQANEAPAAYVSRVALAKARAAWDSPLREQHWPVLSADTTVVVDAKILGKPETESEFLAMAGLLSGREHSVLTAVCLKLGTIELHSVETTKVWMRRITPCELALDWASAEPRDKAGGYAIQGRAARYITRIEGSYANVVGLPLHCVDRMLHELQMNE